MIMIHIQGIHEKRIGSEKEFYSMYPDFDFSFYNGFYTDLDCLDGNTYKLMNHYHTLGINEQRFGSEKEFYNMYPDFDLSFYSSFHTDLDSLHTYKLMNHYDEWGKKENFIVCIQILILYFMLLFIPI